MWMHRFLTPPVLAPRRTRASRSRHAVLTDPALLHARDNAASSVAPVQPRRARPAALSLRLGHESFGLASRGPVDIADRSTYPELERKELDEQGRLCIEPGEVVLAPTLERIGLSERLAGLVDGTSDYARLGISVVLCGQVSPGFGHGKGAVLTLEIVHHLRHAVYLRPGARICNLMLFATKGSDQLYGSMPHNYSSDQRVVPSRLADHVSL